MTIFVFICKTDKSKPVKLEVNDTVKLPPLVFPGHWSKNGGSSGVIDVYEFLLTLAPWPSWQQVETILFVNVLPKE
jgi:hypothetical protein